MARTIKMDALELKIEKAQQEVIKTKKAYDAATAALKVLLDKRDAVRKEEIITAIAKSSHTYEEIMRFISGSATTTEMEG